MGDISDFYVNSMLEKHMNPEKEIYKILKEERDRKHILLINMSDSLLIENSVKCLIDGNFNDKFEKVSRGILRDYDKYKMKLSEKQRNALYGLLEYVDIK